MESQSGSGVCYAQASVTASLSIRLHHSTQFLIGAACLARRAKELDKLDAVDFDKWEHRACVIGTIQQSVAALESESWEICSYGLGSHLGSNGVEEKSIEILSHLSSKIDKEKTLVRFKIILERTRCLQLDLGSIPCQQAKLLIDFRNRLAHPKSQSDKILDDDLLVQQLGRLGHPPPRFGMLNGCFPDTCLSYRFANWAIEVIAHFIEAFYSRTGIPGPLAGFYNQFPDFRPQQVEAIRLCKGA